MSSAPGRLDAVVSLLDARASRVVDIGCERATVAGQVRSAGYRYIGIERTLALTREAQPNAPRMSLCAHGLSALELTHADQITCAGIGEAGIIHILSSWPAWPSWRGRLICCPSAVAGELRPWLRSQGWGVQHEVIAAEGGRFYPVLAAEWGRAWPDDENACLLGPVLTAGDDPHVRDWLSDLCRRHRRMPQDAIGARAAVVAAARRWLAS